MRSVPSSETWPDSSVQTGKDSHSTFNDPSSAEVKWTFILVVICQGKLDAISLTWFWEIKQPHCTLQLGK